MGHRLDVLQGLHAGAEHRQIARIGAGQQPGGDARDGGGADRGDGAGVHHRQQAPPPRLEEQHRALVRIQLGAVVPREDRDGLEADGGR